MPLFLDFAAPNITAPSNVTIYCGESISPSIRRYPNISDAQDPSPSVTYEDKYSTNCTIIRTWTATDHARNVATKRQKLKIVSFSPIHVCKVFHFYQFMYVNYSLVLITALLVLLVGEWHFFQA